MPKSIVLITLISLVFISSLATATFTLNSWEVVDHYGYPSIYITFNTTESLYVRLIAPDGTTADTTYIDKYEHGLYLSMAAHYETPQPGEYKLIVERNTWSGEEIVYSKTFSFKGSNFSIKDIYIEWEHHNGYYETTYISVECQNSGDLPAYVDRLIIDIGDDRLDTHLMPLWMPGKGVNTSWGYTYTKLNNPDKMLRVYEPGEYSIYARIFDEYDRLVTTFTKNITVGEIYTPPAEQNNEETNSNMGGTIDTPGFETVYALIAIITVLILFHRFTNNRREN